MGGFSVVEEAVAVGKRENGDTWGNLHVHSQHRRSKSTSDRNASVLRGGVSRSIKQDQDVLPLPYSASASRGQSPLHDYANCFNKNNSSNHRASLEKDIEQLQLRLQQERSMRIMLERTMGRASSTLSPGHRHFSAQTRELIAEIELLEEEVANREQHVLSLYRTIFDNSASRPPSAQNSGKASPAHTKHGSRKHPSIISSAFCSSKKFPLQPLQALVCMDDRWKRFQKTSHTPLSNGKSSIDLEKTCFDPTKMSRKVIKRV